MTALLAAVFTSCSQKSSQNLEWIPFTWESGSDWGKYIEKMSIIVPVSIDELPYKFTMQFDIGTYSTGFHLNPIKPFLDKYPSLKNKLDTTKYHIHNVDLQMGKVLFKGIDMEMYLTFDKEHSLDSINSETEIHIGTIAADLFQNKVLIIDYKLSRLAVLDAIPFEYRNVSFVKFKTYRGLVKIPFRINGNEEYLLFDTGGSYFSMATTKQNAQAIGGTEIVDSLRATSWDKWISFYGLEIIAPVMFGKKTLESSIVYYTECEGFEDIYQSLNVWGLAGNGYFLNDVVIIDYKNNRFGVK
jgi:hypothetical protein